MTIFLFGLGVLTLFGFALYRKGDVKAGMKMFGVEFFVDTKERVPQQVTTAATAEGVSIRKGRKKKTTQGPRD
jgi:hypothetical protein